jgi:hypothetical protein
MSLFDLHVDPNHLIGALHLDSTNQNGNGLAKVFMRETIRPLLAIQRNIHGITNTSSTSILLIRVCVYRNKQP